MRITTKVAIVLITIALCAKLSAQQTTVIINLTEQTAYLLEDGRVAFVSPIASGRGLGNPDRELQGHQQRFEPPVRKLRSDHRLLRQNNQSKRDSRLIRTPGLSLHVCSDAVLHGVPQIRRAACGLSAWLPGIARLCSDAQRPCC
jgi:hypothetical protein